MNRLYCKEGFSRSLTDFEIIPVDGKSFAGMILLAG
jgi:hypothetical protein